MDFRQAVGRPISHFRNVSDLRFFMREDGFGKREACVDLTICTDDSPPASLALRFVGVRDFRVRNLGGGLARFVGFDVEAVKDRQLESIRWEVVDFENDDLHFYCDSIELVGKA